MKPVSNLLLVYLFLLLFVNLKAKVFSPPLAKNSKALPYRQIFFLSTRKGIPHILLKLIYNLSCLFDFLDTALPDFIFAESWKSHIDAFSPESHFTFHNNFPRHMVGCNSSLLMQLIDDFRLNPASCQNLYPSSALLLQLC